MWHVKRKGKDLTSKGSYNLRGCSEPLQGEQLLALIIELHRAGRNCIGVARNRRQSSRKHCIALAEEVKGLFEAAGLQHSLPCVAKSYPGPAPSFEPECPEANELGQELGRSNVQVTWVKQKDKAALVYKALVPTAFAKDNKSVYARPLSTNPQARPHHHCYNGTCASHE